MARLLHECARAYKPCRRSARLAPLGRVRSNIMSTTSQDLRARNAKARRATAIAALLLGAAVAFGLGVYARAHAETGHAPITLGFQIPGQMKIWFTRAAASLAVLQLASGLWINGRIRLPRRPPSWFPIAHRSSGALAVLLAVPVAYDCVAAFGFHTESPRVILHGSAGLVLFGAFVAKVVTVQRRRRPPWLIPAAGLTLFVALALLWLTSIGWPISVY